MVFEYQLVVVGSYGLDTEACTSLFGRKSDMSEKHRATISFLYRGEIYPDIMGMLRKEIPQGEQIKVIIEGRKGRRVLDDFLGDGVSDFVREVGG